MPAKIIPIKNTLFLPYQKRWIEDDSRLKIMEKSRQIGMSWSSAYALVRRKATANAQLDGWVSSRDETQAKLFIEDCKKFCKLLDIASEDLGVNIIDDKGSSSYTLKFANSLRIHSMSSNPDAQAGKRGDRLLDEFALHGNPRKLYSIAYPGVTWGGQLEIVSTHRGSANFFNELIREIREKDNPKGISLHTVTLENALADGFLYKLQSKLPKDSPIQEMDETDYFNFIKNGCADEESFLQEYCCIPADDNSAFLSYDLIASCEMPPVANLSDLSNFSDLSDFYVGVDVARKKDFTAIFALEYSNNRFVTKRLITLKDMKFSQQEHILYSILEHPKMRRCCIDATGLGAQFAERAQERFGKYRVEAVNFSAPVKADLAYPLKAAFEDRNILIPFDKNLRADLRAIKKETTSAGNERFSADRSENGHSDRFWALALAVHAAKDATGGKSELEANMAQNYSKGTSKEFWSNRRNVEKSNRRF